MAKKRTRPKSTIQTKISDRKARRKQERKSKKKKPRTGINERTFDDWTKFRSQEIQKEQEESKAVEKTKSIKHENLTKAKTLKDEKNTKKTPVDIYDVVDEKTAAAMRKDDEEISRLEEKLGLNKGKADKKKLNKEYSKLEGYGDDFGDFLDGLDSMLVNIAGDEEYDDIDDLEYDSDESDPAIARAKFLIRQEHMGVTVKDDSNEEESDSDPDEEMIPMKQPAGEDLSGDEDEDNYADSGDVISKESESNNDEEGESSDEDKNSSKGDDEEAIERDHDEKDTYRPRLGQDLYGNQMDDGQDQRKKPSAYIPPHLRKLKAHENGSNAGSRTNNNEDLERENNLRLIQKLLNNNLNRLSDNTLESVSKSIANIYKLPEYSSRDVNDKYWKNVQSACVVPHMVMSSLIPIYMACVSGVHYQTGDVTQLNSFIIENVVLGLWRELNKNRCDHSSSQTQCKHDPEEDKDPIHSNKEASNMMMIICYLYNYNTVHCSLIYDIVRKLIESFTEIDVELLLLILQHCGSQLRSDDPTALKDIVLLVQERSMEVIKLNGKDTISTEKKVATSSRAQFMITAITDLKNNKRRGADNIIADKTSQYRRMIGRVKSASESGSGRRDGLRISVQDIIDIETNGRWWVVGGTWVGNHRRSDTDNQGTRSEKITNESLDDIHKTANSYLKKLAARQRMNTDLRRSIFFIIMGSDDCQDAFEKLVRGSLLKGKPEREVIRILFHCCGQEKVYNPYYSHLANLICDHQNKCKFTIQLCLWDSFKQFDNMKHRKTANLAKLMAHLVMNFKLNLNVLRRIDISPDGMSESAIIFLMILFSNIFEAYEEPEAVVDIFKRGQPTKEQLLKKANEHMDDDDAFAGNGRQALKDSLSIFLMHFLEKSPKNVKKSNFRKNLKAAMKVCEEDNFDYMI